MINTDAIRKGKVAEFVNGVIGNYSVLNSEISITDSQEQYYTDFEVRISNTTNAQIVCAELRCHGESGVIEICRGEDFYPVSEVDFLMDLFLTKFLTFVEV